jgi:hypothetical protein
MNQILFPKRGYLLISISTSYIFSTGGKKPTLLTMGIHRRIARRTITVSRFFSKYEDCPPSVSSHQKKYSFALG